MPAGGPKRDRNLNVRGKLLPVAQQCHPAGKQYHMQIRSIRIRNFRGLVDTEIPLARTTVLFGENCCGKTSVLDGIAMALRRVSAPRRMHFSDYDMTMNDEIGQISGEGTEISAKNHNVETTAKAQEASIQLTFSESMKNRWPEEIVNNLSDVIQTDLITGLYSIYRRSTYAGERSTAAYDERREFLDSNGNPVAASASRRSSMDRRLLDYVPSFSLSALRDTSEEFSLQSQFWRNLLRSIEIPADRQRKLAGELNHFNDDLVQLDPRMKELTRCLNDIKAIVSSGAVSEVQIRALPLKIRELLNKAKIVVKGNMDGPWLPLDRCGQGVRGLTVMFLYKAFVDSLINEASARHSEPILTIDEPEAHLHPQAIRALWEQIDSLPGQKIVATHSPYFLQHVPMHNIRHLRREAGGIKIYFVRECESVCLPVNNTVESIARNSNGQLTYEIDEGRESDIARLVAHQAIDDSVRQRLTQECDALDDLDYRVKIDRLCDRSTMLLTPSDISDIDEFARRVRGGEMFFSRKWLLCEGASEVYLLRALFEAFGSPLDNRGVAVIECGGATMVPKFAKIAHILGFPWVVLLDNDREYSKVLDQMDRESCFDGCEIRHRIVTYPERQGLEKSILEVNALRKEAIHSIRESQPDFPEDADSTSVFKELKRGKRRHAQRMARRIRKLSLNISELPAAFQQLHSQILSEE